MIRRLELFDREPHEILRIEGERQDGRFAVLDDFIGDVSLRMFEGLEPLKWVAQGARPTNVEYPWLVGSQRSQLEDMYDPETVRSRGGWFLPEKGVIAPGWISLFRFIDAEPRFAVNNARNTRGKPNLKTWEAVLTWSLTNRIAEDLFKPFELRGPLAGKVSSKQITTLFADYRRLLRILEIDVGDHLTPFLPGNGWSRWGAPEKAELRVKLRKALHEGWSDGSGRLYRARYLSQLIGRYSNRVESDGRALRRNVISKQYGPHLVALFGGDWMQFLDYLEAEPHSDEEVVQALPAANLYIADRKRIEDVAIAIGAEHGEVAKIAAALFASEVADSPIEDRLAVLKEIWGQFDQAHANQRSGLKPLPSVLTSGFLDFGLVRGGHELDTTPIESILNGDTLDRVNRLWGTALFERWPGRLYTEILPFSHVAKALGPAFEFWHGVGLTAWYFAEGPYSRTDIAGMSEYYLKLTESLDEAGHPVDPHLFADLSKAEKKLGPPEDIVHETVSTGPISVSMISGQRREGFRFLRDVVTEHRRIWADQHLDAYLRRWRSILQELHTYYHRRLADTGRTPTVRQFSRIAKEAANCWFGGDLRRVYAVIGEESPVDPVYERLMPVNVEGLARTVFDASGGRPLEKLTTKGTDDVQTSYQAEDCARGAIRFIQLREAKGEDPTVPEFGTAKWKRFSDLFGEDPWHQFIQIIDDAVARITASESGLPTTSTVSQTTRTAAPAQHLPTAPALPQAGKDQAKSKKKSLLDWLLRR